MTMYADLLGHRLARLPMPLRAIHERAGAWTYRGEVAVRAGTGLIARLFATAARLPSRYDGPIEVEIFADAEGERWTRRFGAHVMRSRLCSRNGCLRERLGPVRFDFALETDEATICWRVLQVRVLGLPLPATWFAGVRAVESAQEGIYRFDVRADLPGVGQIVHYAGWLDVA